VYAIDDAAHDRAAAGELVELSANSRSPLFRLDGSVTLLIGKCGARPFDAWAD
jgi:hypothetical protein